MRKWQDMEHEIQHGIAPIIRNQMCIAHYILGIVQLREYNSVLQLRGPHDKVWNPLLGDEEEYNNTMMANT